MIYEIKSVFRRPVFLAVIFVYLIVSIFAAQSIVKSIDELPSFIYFTMGFSLLFLLYGAEQARFDIQNQLHEFLLPVPHGKKYYLHKLLGWILLTWLVYLIFYTSIVLYITNISEQTLTWQEIYTASLYTLACWYVPFFLSVLLGYTIFTIQSSLMAYPLLIALWLVISPLNRLIGILPDKWASWLAIGDPNAELTEATFMAEHMILNRGSVYQRLLAILVIFSLFLLVVPVFKKSKAVVGSSMIFLAISVGILVFAPSQLITEEIKAQPKKGYIKQADQASHTNYKITSYKMDIEHKGNNHSFAYTAAIEFETEQDSLDLCLFDEMKVEHLLLNGQVLKYAHQGNILHIELPSSFKGKGSLQLQVHSDQYVEVNHTSFQLLATQPWYPMNPMEAAHPYQQAKKEYYEIRIQGANNGKIVSNLKQEGAAFTGEAYGPTLVYGPYKQEENGVYFQRMGGSKFKPDFYQEQVDAAIQEGNSRLGTSIAAPSKLWLVPVTTLDASSNPDEIYLVPSFTKLDRAIFQSIFE